MKKGATWSVLAGRERMTLPDGTELRLLTAMEVLEARREALSLSNGEMELALCSNACLLARAWSKAGKPLCTSGEELLQRLSPSQIQKLAKRFADFDREENPSVLAESKRVEAIKKAWSTPLGSAFAGVCSERLARSPRKREQRK